MQLNSEDMQALMREGAEALRQGRAGEARERFEKVTASGWTDERPWLLLAAACGAEKDVRAEEAALNHLLELEPASVRGQIMKGDCRARAGDPGLATYFYRSALRLAEGRRLPEEVLTDIRRAQASLQQLERRAHGAREVRLRARGLPPAEWSPRFRHSLELAAGHRKLYLQQPTAFTYPQLPQIQFYDAAQFEWAQAVEAAAPVIREELLKLLDQSASRFRAYIQEVTGAIPIAANKALLNDKAWSVLPLCENGFLEPEIVRNCPRTWETILRTPLPRVSGWGPTVTFSMLKAGAHIAAHTGMFNTRLICHLPLIVPPGCRFRVGNEVREWEQGKLLIFDDTIEHEAWNDSSEDRVVLIFDIWRPELSDQEKHELTALFSD